MVENESVAAVTNLDTSGPQGCISHVSFSGKCFEISFSFWVDCTDLVRRSAREQPLLLYIAFPPLFADL